MTAQTKGVDVLDGLIQALELLTETARTPAELEGLGEMLALAHRGRTVLLDLVAAANRVALSVECPGVFKQSKKNPNAGFVDTRDWMALVGEAITLRAALARCGSQP